MPAGLEAASRYANLALRAFGEENDLIPPGIALEDGSLPDWQYQKRMHLWTTRQSTVASVGVNNGMAIGNLTPNMIVVVLQVQNLAGGNLLYMQEIVQQLPANYSAYGSNVVYRNDSRYNATQVAGVGVSVKSAGGQSAGFSTTKLSLADPTGTQSAATPPGWFTVLMPGRGVWFEQSVQNITMAMQAMGYAREAEPQELVA